MPSAKIAAILAWGRWVKIWPCCCSSLQTKFIFLTRFWFQALDSSCLSSEVSFGLRVLELSVSVCPSVCPWVCLSAYQSWVWPCENSSSVQTGITKFGPKVQNTLDKILVDLWGDWPWHSRSNLKMPYYILFSPGLFIRVSTLPPEQMKINHLWLIPIFSMSRSFCSSKFYNTFKGVGARSPASIMCARKCTFKWPKLFHLFHNIDCCI